MQIQSYKDIKKSDILWSYGWYFNTLVFDKYEKIKENKKSIRYKITRWTWEFKDTAKMEFVNRYEDAITISFDKILYSKVPYFTTKEEAIQHLRITIEEELERAKKKIEYLPRIIDFSKTLIGEIE